MPFARKTTARGSTPEPLAEPELFDYAVRALSRRMRTERDLRRLLKGRAEPGESGDATIDRIVARLLELNYLSDSRFAEDYTRLRKENQGFGRRRVEQDLAVKGINKEIAQTTLAAAYDDTDEVALARAFCERKRIPRPEGPDAAKLTARLMNRLLRAGFSSRAITQMLRAWRVEVPEAGGDSDSYAEFDETLPEF